jgi:hypothetical protein
VTLLFCLWLKYDLSKAYPRLIYAILMACFRKYYINTAKHEVVQ